MSETEILPSLSLLTLIAVAVIAAIALVLFLRKKGNRHPMDTPRERAILEERDRDITKARDSAP